LLKLGKNLKSWCYHSDIQVVTRIVQAFENLTKTYIGVFDEETKSPSRMGGAEGRCWG